ncbi:methyltransferase domain-containing protein, partial [Duganella sp. FT94W]
MSQDFYRAFEDRYRGARETIKQRQAVYRPFLRALADSAAGVAPAALDLGCGRGEWLELLGECGLAGRGVDLDEGMLRACRERHLDVSRADALGSLRALPDASLALVSAFHLVEHLPFAMVQEIIAEAQRVLRPGGLLVLETPNPENLTVGASSFYLDPSHERPLPPPLLDFAVEFGHFARRRVLRLQEEAALHGPRPVALIHVLEGVSPDYAVVAQKDGPAALLARFDPLFAADYGVTLSALAGRYEAQQQQQQANVGHALQRHDQELAALHAAHAGVAADLEGQHALNALLQDGAAALAQQDAQLAQRLGMLNARLESDAQHAAALAAQQSAHNVHIAAELQALHAALPGLHWQLAHHAERLAAAELRNAQHEQRIVDLLGSSSWRVTAPLRWAGDSARRLVRALREGRLVGAARHRAWAALL